ncbi:MAG: prolyl oligopeptidase family protein [bacterium]
MSIQCRSAWFLAFCLVILVFIGACGESALEYPQSKRIAQTDDYFGVTVADPYRWLEELDSPDTKAWVTAQNDLSRPYLEGIARRESIKERLTEVWNYERYGIPFKEGGKYFYTRNDGLQNQSVFYVADALDAEPRVLIDPNVLRKDATMSLRGTSVSPNGQYIAYAISDGGSDWTSWKIRNIETGEDLEETLNYTKFTPASWSRDSKGFYYSRYPAAGTNGDSDAVKGDGSKAVSVFYHRVGTEQTRDKLVYAIPEHPRQNPYAIVTHDGRFLIINVQEGFQTNAIYYRNLRSRNARVRPLFDKWDAFYTVLGNKGNELYVNTNKDTPMGKVVAVNISNPSPNHWREIIPESDKALQSANYVGGVFIARYLKDAQTQVKIFDRRGEMVREVDLPGVGSAFGFAGQPDDAETFYSFTSFTSPPTIYQYNLVSGESSLFKKADVKGVAFDDYETKQVFYTSKDGTRIPMFIIHKKGIELNGQNPTLLYGYGGFNISLTPAFRADRMVWLELGGVLAVPNLRGGGEYGEEWHLAGTKTHKQNVFDDFIAAAEWLIENKYTSTPKLAIQGGSNGGLLVGACLTQRPDLFGAALPAVGVLDMLRYHTASANARGWSSDYGLSENEEEFKALYAYSPYHNIKENTCYPPTLVTTADHDDRVVPWHSFKFGAALQHAQNCSNPVLVRVETRAGHGAGTPTWMRIENIADQWAFLVKALDMD